MRQPQGRPGLLTAAEARRLFHYDPATGRITWRVARGPLPAGAEAGTVTRNGYRRIGTGGRIYLAHRLAWLLHHGAWPATELDHVNGDKLDNRAANLREASHPENAHNAQAPQVNGTSGFRGVSWHRGRWQASIRVGGRLINLGMFATPEAAAAAYLAAKRAHHPTAFDSATGAPLRPVPPRPAK